MRCSDRNDSLVRDWHTTNDPEIERLRGILDSQACTALPLNYHGGPVLKSIIIYPLYYGSWDPNSRQAHLEYLNGLAAYLSGSGAPTGKQPMTRQYGLVSARVGPAVNVPNAPADVTPMNIEGLIHFEQSTGRLPPFDDHALIMVIRRGSVTDERWCGYHGTIAGRAGAYIYLWPAGCDELQLVTAHEVFEAVADPKDDGINSAWNDPADPCQRNTPAITLGFGRIPSIADNTQNGVCSITGFAPVAPSGVLQAEKYGYLWSSDPDAESNEAPAAFQFNSSGGTNTVTHSRSQPGVYVAHFPGLASVGGTVNVSAYGMGSEMCGVDLWNPVNDEMQVIVHCYNAAGDPANAQFTLSYTAGQRATRAAIATDLAYVRGSPGNAAADYQFAPFGAGESVTLTGTGGNYTVAIPRQTQSSLLHDHGGGTVMVTAYQGGGRWCKAADWTYGGGDALMKPIVVSVVCFAPGGAAADSQFILSFHRHTDLLGRFSSDHAYVWAHMPTIATYVPISQYQFNSQSGALSVSRSATGTYTVTIPGQHHTGGHVQVMAVGMTSEHCKIQRWAANETGGQDVLVRCFRGNALEDAKFALSYIAP